MSGVQAPPTWPAGSIVRGFSREEYRILAVSSYNAAKRLGISLTGFFEPMDHDRPFYLLQYVGKEHLPTPDHYDAAWRALIQRLVPGQSVHSAYFADTIGTLIRLGVPDDNMVDE